MSNFIHSHREWYHSHRDAQMKITGSTSYILSYHQFDHIIKLCLVSWDATIKMNFSCRNHHQPAATTYLRSYSWKQGIPKRTVDRMLQMKLTIGSYHILQTLLTNYRKVMKYQFFIVETSSEMFSRYKNRGWWWSIF